MNNPNIKGFTLIEVLLAVSIIAISLTALLKSFSQNINYTSHIKTKILETLVAKNSINLITLGIIHLKDNEQISEVTTILNQKIFWQAKLLPTQYPKIKKIEIFICKDQMQNKCEKNLTGYMQT